MGEQDLFVRANKVLIMAELIGCRKYLTAHELVKVLDAILKCLLINWIDYVDLKVAIAEKQTSYGRANKLNGHFLLHRVIRAST